MWNFGSPQLPGARCGRAPLKKSSFLQSPLWNRCELLVSWRVPEIFSAKGTFGWSNAYVTYTLYLHAFYRSNHPEPNLGFCNQATPCAQHSVRGLLELGSLRHQAMHGQIGTRTKAMAFGATWTWLVMMRIHGNLRGWANPTDPPGEVNFLALFS